MIRFEVTIGWWDENNWQEKTERGIACGPTAQDTLKQIEDYYGDDIQDVKIIYTDDMDSKIYIEEDEDTRWLTKEG